MIDQGTIGALVASVLALASEETVKGFVGEAGKDAWKAIRNKVARWGGCGFRGA